MEHLSEIVVTGLVFFGIYHILVLISDYFLKRKLIKAGQYEKVGILEAKSVVSEETNKYPSLKWGLVALMTGIGLIVIEIMRASNPYMWNVENAVLPFGILLVFISSGFLLYFFFMNRKKN